MKKRIVLLSLLVLALPLFAKSKATITKMPEKFYWEISGTDKNGNSSKVYVLGTIHLGDDRLFPLPEKILSDFDNANIISGELSTEGLQNISQVTTNKMMSMFINDPKKLVNTKLSKEDNELLENLLGKEVYQSLVYFKPAALRIVVDSLVTSQYSGQFTSSYDAFFIERATKSGRYMQGLDPVETQVDVLFYGDYDFQLKMLELSIESLKDSTEFLKEITQLYEAYLTSDEKTMTDVYEGQMSNEIKEFSKLKKYYKFLLTDRNKLWAEKFNDYLNEGGTTFIFAGVGHFVGKDSVFNLMKKKGYLQK